MDNQEIKLPVVQVTQSIGTFFIGRIGAKEFFIPCWSSNNERVRCWR